MHRFLIQPVLFHCPQLFLHKYHQDDCQYHLYSKEFLNSRYRLSLYLINLLENKEGCQFGELGELLYLCLRCCCCCKLCHPVFLNNCCVIYDTITWSLFELVYKNIKVIRNCNSRRKCR